MPGLFLNALKDSAEMVPFLLVIYCLVEWFERRFGETIEARMQNAAKFGPALGALFGCIPQCGFSVVASSMYARRLITKGTLLAVLLATSDEAIPIMLAMPGKGRIVVALVVTKLIIAIVGGYTVDLLLRKRSISPAPDVPARADESDGRGCCKHSLSGTAGKWQWLTHPLIHTAKVFVFIVAVTLGINCLIALAGEANLGSVLLRKSIFQPCLTALFGLVPNCAASVAIAAMFLKGGLSYGSAVAGLCSSGGIGILVLVKENRDTRDTIKVLLVLVAISAAAGIAIQLLMT